MGTVIVENTRQLNIQQGIAVQINDLAISAVPIQRSTEQSKKQTYTEQNKFQVGN